LPVAKPGREVTVSDNRTTYHVSYLMLEVCFIFYLFSLWSDISVVNLV